MGDKSEVLVAILKEAMHLIMDLHISKHFFAIFACGNGSLVKNLDIVSVGKIYPFGLVLLIWMLFDIVFHVQVHQK